MRRSAFLPMSTEEADGPVDIILITGDAYVDHPSWGVSAIGRWLQHAGYSVGIIAQPDHTDVEAFRVLGRPRLFFGVTAGNMDSMVNKFTAARRLRTSDAYSPGGEVGSRPDRATIPYTAKAKQAFSGVPVIVGGVEASLRRQVHFDYWQDRLRGSILIDSKADLLVHGMAENTVVEIARRLDQGLTIKDCYDIPGTAHALGAKGSPPTENVIVLPSLEEIRADSHALGTSTKIMYRESNPHCGKTLLQLHGKRCVVLRPPALALTTAELDKLHALPFTYRRHSCYRKPIPAMASIEGSISINRGCSGGCSFCALTIHQGKDVVSRSTESIVNEAKGMKDRPGFKGIITDLGGPTANMFHMRCMDDKANKICRRISCLHPTKCKHYGTDHGPYIDLLRKTRSLPGIRRVYVNSGIRYDLADMDPNFIEELAKHHVQGQLSVAPEHASPKALKQMRKPNIEYFTSFMERFKKASEDAGKEQFLVPYFICAHPGVGPEETIELAIYMKEQGLRPRQVQMFMPTPATLATACWLSETDIYTKKPLVVAKGRRERSRQRALLFYWKREEWPHVREALQTWKRPDLIGRGKGYLVPPGPSWGAWKNDYKKGQLRYDTHMGAKIERARPGEEDEERWEPVAPQPANSAKYRTP